MLGEQEQREPQEREQQEQDEYQNAMINNEIMNKLKIDILNMYKKIRMCRRGAYAPPLTPLTSSVKGGVIGECSFPTSVYLNHAKLREEYRTILEKMINTINNQPTTEGKHRGKWHGSILYKVMAHTRDIVDGYGERDLAYMQLFEWARVVDVSLAKHALELFVNNIGSWKDVKSFYAYMRRVVNVRDDRDMRAYIEMTEFMVGMVNARLAADVLAFYGDGDEDDNNDDVKDTTHVSLVSKWIPRENKSKKYGNLYERLACDYYKMWLPNDKSNTELYDKAVLKCKIHYRKLIAFFNKYLDTPQIKMCEQNWANIKFDGLTRRTQKLQNNALLNLNGDREPTMKQSNQSNQRSKQNKDRETCADKYKTWRCEMLNYKRGISSSLGCHVSSVYYGTYNIESDKNAEWRAYLTRLETANTTNLKYMIPVLSGASFNAIGLALAVAERTVIGRKLLMTTTTTAGTANSKTRNLEVFRLEDSFVKNVKKIRTQTFVNNNDNDKNKDKDKDKDKLNIYLSLTAVLQTMIDSGITPKELKEYPQLTVVIFADRESDVRIGECETCDCMCKFNSAYNEAVRLYTEFGYVAPKILLWALKSESESECQAQPEPQLQYYSSGSILSRRVGCGENDIVKFLGIINEKQDKDLQKRKRKQKIQQQLHQQQQPRCEDSTAWHEEWNLLTNQLYNSHMDFVNCFWKCM
jgi:hypothetical protein